MVSAYNGNSSGAISADPKASAAASFADFMSDDKRSSVANSMKSLLIGYSNPAEPHPGMTATHDSTRRKASSMNKKPTKRQPARKPRSRRVLHSPSAPAKHQGGRVRAWFAKNAGLFCVAVGWVFTFALVAIPKTHDNAVSIIELACFGSMFFGFGLGWIVRDETGKRNGR